MPRTKKPKEPGRRFKHFGRPTKYTKEVADEICERLSGGQTLLKICKDEGMPHRKTIHSWILTIEEFRNNYTLARELQAEYWADEINDIADDGSNDYSEDEDGNRIVNHDHIKRSQLRVSVRQWNAARRAPKKWGDRQALEMSGPDGQAINPVHIYIPSNGRENSNEKPKED